MCHPQLVRSSSGQVEHWASSFFLVFNSDGCADRGQYCGQTTVLSLPLLFVGFCEVTQTKKNWCRDKKITKPPCNTRIGADGVQMEYRWLTNFEAVKKGIVLCRELLTCSSPSCSLLLVLPFGYLEIVL